MKYVIQNHIAEDEHFDLMIETKDIDALLTWKIGKKDLDTLINGSIIKAEKLADHRKEYLTYEGTVSKGRGIVKIFDSGECRTVLCKTSNFKFELNGKKLKGIIFLENTDNNMFFIQYTPKIQLPT